MMHYKINHVTTYEYAEPVSVCHNQVLLTPCEDPRIECRSHRLLIRPTPTDSSKRQDMFGNHIHRFSVERSHRKLQITATSRVSVSGSPHFDTQDSPTAAALAKSFQLQQDHHWFDAWLFLRDSPRVRRHPEFEAYARHCIQPTTPVLKGIQDLTERIHDEFAYDAQATDVDTDAVQAFEKRRGVCQDFAHIQISCLRSLGIPARYVSGYLRTLPPKGQPRLVGADQSHAWVSAYCGEELGWIEIDPTNKMLASMDHVPVARGRDYGDVAPVRGVYVGGGQHALRVTVDVCPEEN